MKLDPFNTNCNGYFEILELVQKFKGLYENVPIFQTNHEEAVNLALQYLSKGLSNLSEFYE